MMTTKKNKATFQTPDFSISKINQEKGNVLFGNFFNGTKNRLLKNPENFSSFSMIKRALSKSKDDPTMEFILEVIRRLEKDKVNSEISMQIAELAQSQAQNLQKVLLVKMIPFLVSILGIVVLATLTLMTRPLSFANPELLKFIIPMVLFVPLLLWGMQRRKEAKFDLLTANIVSQGASAYASAKMQGKGQIGALQNLEEMRRRAKTLEAKKNQDTKKDKK